MSNALTAYPTPERVGSKVCATLHKSCFSAPVEEKSQRGNAKQNPLRFSQGSFQKWVCKEGEPFCEEKTFGDLAGAGCHSYAGDSQPDMA